MMEMTPLQVFRRRLFLYEQQRILIKQIHPGNMVALERIDIETERCIQEYVHEQGIAATVLAARPTA